MGKRFFMFVFLLLSLLLSSIFSATEARALRDSKLQYSNTSKKNHEAVIKGLLFRAVKISGPSPGVGHRYNNLHTIEVEKSGPSPGQGLRSLDPSSPAAATSRWELTCPWAGWSARPDSIRALVIYVSFGSLAILPAKLMETSNCAQEHQPSIFMGSKTTRIPSADDAAELSLEFEEEPKSRAHRSMESTVHKQKF
ncbi:hypothetical protein CRYUN_Cryun10bG0114800 [Craigia yunnanensis]